jgi:glucosamine--fructose-6-phosphate aminotransferase (isomerizing)
MTSLVEEIKEQPQALHQTLDDLDTRLDVLSPWTEKIRTGEIKRVVFTGMGSSFFAVQPALTYLSERGIAAIPIDASELLYYHTGLLDEHTLTVAISQSGESIEIRKVVEQFGASAPLVGVTNNPDSTLARLSDGVLYMKAGKEETVSSKTYTCTLAVLHLMARALAGENPAPAAAALRQMADAVGSMFPVWETQTNEMVSKVEGVQALVFLGRGPSLASALTGALITKETAKLPTEGMSSGQYRHGPIEATSPKLGVCIFPGGRMRALNLGLARDLAAIGGRVIVIDSAAQPIEGVLNVDLPAGDEAVAPVAEIVPIQLFAVKLAESRGLEAGKFYYGGKITTQE